MGVLYIIVLAAPKLGGLFWAYHMVFKKVKIDNKFIFDIRSLRMFSGVYPCFLILLKCAVGGVWNEALLGYAT